MECEEEVQTADKSAIEATKERRRTASPRRARRLPSEREHARGLVLFDRPTVDRSEYSSLNGIGAPLRR